MRSETKTAVECMIAMSRKNIARDCRALAQTLTLLATRCANTDIPDLELIINPLGEIQAQGPMIDAACGSIATEIRLWQFIQEMEDVH